jgi:GT2 family glycosyltransferase
MSRPSDEPRPHVAVVILTWNGRDDTLECLESLGSADWRPLTTIVVDNGSEDDTAEAIRTRFADVELVRSPENVGYAQGNNLGIRRALDLGADYVLVLNNDTLVDSQAIAMLVREARARPDAAAVCPLIYFAEPDDVVWYAGACFDPRKIHNGRQAGYRERDTGQFAGVRDVERASGAAMLVPAAVWEQVGLFDAELFLQFEDVDWSLRARSHGYRLYLVPDARVWHKVSVASGGEHSLTVAYYLARNTLEVSARHAPRTGLRAARRHWGIVAVHLLRTRRSRQKLACIRSVLEGERDYRRGRLGRRRGAGDGARGDA